MALFKAVVWALIFLTKLRFPPGVSIAIVLKTLSLQKFSKDYKTINNRFYLLHFISFSIDSALIKLFSVEMRHLFDSGTY